MKTKWKHQQGDDLIIKVGIGNESKMLVGRKDDNFSRRLRGLLRNVATNITKATLSGMRRDI